MMKLTYNDYEKIACGDIPLIDVRAPIEFEKGAFLNAVNIPLMNDEERHLVGICYKEKGNEEAVKLGHHLVSGKTRLRRIKAWEAQLNKYPNSIIYCFRGGLRSQLSQKWIMEEVGLEVPRLEGGYKEFRNYLINALKPEQQNSKPILLGGCTGGGKTLLLNKLKDSIDLEGIANHRGSSFGKQITPQPSQINFENNLAYALIKHKQAGYSNMILEDEGKNVGRCYLPKLLAQYFNSGDLVILEVPFDERVLITMNEYVFQSQELYREIYSKDQGLYEWSQYIINSLSNIKKRLGGDCYKHIMDLFTQADNEQRKTGDDSLHKNWIESLLRDYYDPMYQYQIQKSTKKIIFKGNTEEVLDYLS